MNDDKPLIHGFHLRTELALLRLGIPAGDVVRWGLLLLTLTPLVSSTSHPPPSSSSSSSDCLPIVCTRYATPRWDDVLESPGGGGYMPPEDNIIIALEDSGGPGGHHVALTQGYRSVLGAGYHLNAPGWGLYSC